MAPDFAAAEEGSSPGGVDREPKRSGSPLSGLDLSSRGMQQTMTAVEDGARAPSSPAAKEARSRFGQQKLKAVREELRRAELCFQTAGQLLVCPQVREAAGRIADALGRASRAIDSVEKGAAVHPAVEALAGVSRFDPATRPGDFVQHAGKCIASAGRTLADCPHDDVAYWGRTLGRLARTFTNAKASSPVY